MATTDVNTKSVNFIKDSRIRVVNTLPDLGKCRNGEMFLLISDGDSDDKKIHIRVATGWLKTSALS